MAPISPIMPPATAVVRGQRNGTGWKAALFLPQSGKHNIMVNNAAVILGCAAWSSIQRDRQW